MILQNFLPGVITMGFAVCTLFFLRFWKTTRDRLFLGFAVAFFLLGVGQALLGLAAVSEEERSYLYLFRLAAFLTIIVSIWLKNREAQRR